MIMKLLASLSILLLTFNSFIVQAQNELTIYFETDVYELNKAQKKEIDNWANQNKLSENISVRGFADHTGSDHYNQLLAKKRAEAVAQYLQQAFKIKISADSIIGEGEILKGALAENRKVIISSNLNSQHKQAQNIDKVDFTKVKVGDKLQLYNLIFEGGRRYLLPKSKPTLDSITKVLLVHNNYHFEIQGHVCCTKPTEKDGVDHDTGIRNLSVMRALQIYNYFIEKGIDKNRMTYKGMGGSFPLGGSFEKNRRVEIEITKID